MALPTAQMWSIPNLADSARLVMDANNKANPMIAFANIGTALGNFQDSRAKDFDYRQAIVKAQQDLINQQRQLDPEIWLSDPANAAKYEQLRTLASQGLEQSNQAREQLRALGLAPHVFSALDDTLKYLKAGDTSRESKAKEAQAYASAEASKAHANLFKIQAEDANLTLKDKKAQIEMDNFLGDYNNRQVVSGLIDIINQPTKDGSSGVIQAAQEYKRLTGSSLSLKQIADKLAAFSQLGKPDTSTLDAAESKAIKNMEHGVELIGKQSAGTGLTVDREQFAKIYWGADTPQYNGAEIGSKPEEKGKKTEEKLLNDETLIQQGVKQIGARLLELNPNINLPELNNILRHVVRQNSKSRSWTDIAPGNGLVKLNDDISLDLDQAVEDAKNWSNALEANRPYLEFFHPTTGFKTKFKEGLAAQKKALTDKWNPFSGYKIKNTDDYVQQVVAPVVAGLQGAYTLPHSGNLPPGQELNPLFSDILQTTKGLTHQFNGVKGYNPHIETPEDKTIAKDISPEIKKEAEELIKNPENAPRILPEMIRALTPKQLADLQKRDDLSESQRISIESGIINRTAKEKEEFQKLVYQNKPLEAYALISSPNTFLGLDDIMDLNGSVKLPDGSGQRERLPILRALLMQTAQKLNSSKISKKEAAQYKEVYDNLLQLIEEQNALSIISTQ